MKNLRKVLALVLVVATLCGFATVASATDFSDSSSVKNTEAVEVMNALGVINGYTDGSFKPNGNVTRAEMAKMVTMILNGGEDVGPLYSAGNVFSDCGYHWARGYIAYASNVKLVAGVGNNKFDPDGNVTGAQAAKMLLCALGYDAGAAGYTGSTWASKVLADAKSAGLLDGFARTFDYSAPLNRDNAALMMLNALKADMVEYKDKGSNVTIGGVEIVTGASAPTAVVDSTHPGRININNESGDKIIQLGEDCFENGNKSLKYDSADTDAFGRPSHTWTYNNEDIDTYRDAADVTYTEEVKWDTIRSDTGKIKDANVGDITIVTDGTAASPVTGASAVTLYKGKAPLAGSGAGVLAEVYLSDNALDNAKTDIKVVVINTYAATISKYTAEKLDKNGEVKTEESITINHGGSKIFETHDFTADDEDSWVLYTVAPTGTAGAIEIQEVTVPETVSGVMSRYTSNEVTVGGTKYALSKQHGYPGENVASIADPGDFDNDYTYYLDTYGNVIAAEADEASSTTNYAYLTEMKVDNDTFAETSSVQAKVIFTDGKKATVNVDTFKKGGNETFKNPAASTPFADTTIANAANDANTATTGFTGKRATYGHWVSYSVNSSDEYTFKALGSRATEITAPADNSVTDTLTKDSATINGTGVAGLYMNSKTVVTNVDDDGKVTTFTGLPTKDVTFNNNSKLLVTHAKDSKAAIAIYAVDQAKGLSSESATYAYVVNASWGKISGKDAVEFVVDGEKVVYITEDAGVSFSNGGVYDLSISGEEVTDADPINVTATAGKWIVSDDNGVLRVSATSEADAKGDTPTVSGTYTLADDYAVYDATTDGDGAATSLSAGDKITFVVDGDGKVPVIFVTTFAS